MKDYKEAMNLLGATNIFKYFFLHIKWILKPDETVKLADKIYKKVNSHNNMLARVVAIGYLNEFLSKYLEFGRTHEEVILINENIDKGIKTTNNIENTLIELRKIRQRIKKESLKGDDQTIVTKKGFGVSKGTVSGRVLNIHSATQNIPNNCIGIFPTSGTKHSTQFLKCLGIIFKNGSMTSHGAILAREFEIPAIVSPDININDNEQVEINGIEGTVKRVVDRGN